MFIKEKAVLDKIFKDDISFHDKEIKIQTPYGELSFVIDSDYPSSLPSIGYDTFSKINKEKIESKLSMQLSRLKGNLSIFPIVFFIYQIVEDKITTEVSHSILDGFDELTDVMFYEWANRHKKTKNINTAVTGKEYYEKNILNHLQG